MTDVTVRTAGTLVLFEPHTQRATNWIHANVAEDAQWFGGSLVVEPRYARDLADAMRDAGLRLDIE